jgi:UDP-N-acetylglucosamine 2-epimerase (non-hydrolysing)
MSDVFFKELDIKRPDISIMSGSGSHSEQTGKIMIGLEKIFTGLRPNLVIVVGDVNSTLAAALVTSKLHIPLAHVEAGLRSYDITMPEEINRIVTDRISELLFTPSEDADQNLKKEGIDKSKIYLTGNIMIDTLVNFIKKSDSISVLNKYNLIYKNYCLITLHRPSNVDNRKTFEKLARAINRMSQKIKIVFPVHPRTQARIKKFNLQKYFNTTNIIATKPIGYLDTIGLTAAAKLVVTDSGGIQEETTYLKIPCLTLRDNTERPVTEKVGTNTVVGTDTSLLLKKFEEIIDGKYKKGSIPKYWDGKTSGRIVSILKWRFL